MGQKLAEQGFAIFQSTHPVRGATVAAGDDGVHVGFQSTHPVRGATIIRYGTSALSSYFNPRTP